MEISNMKTIKTYIKNLGYLMYYAWINAKSRYFFAVVAIILDTAQPFFTLIMPKYIIDELTFAKRWDIVLWYIFLFIGVQVAFTLIRSLLAYWDNKSEYRVKFNMSILFNKYFINMDYGRFEDNNVRNKGEIIGLNMNATNLVNVFTTFFTTIFQLIGYAYIVFTLHPLIIVFILLLMFIFKKTSKRSIDLYEQFQKKSVYFDRRIKYLFKSMISFEFGKETRINEASEWLCEKYESETKDYIKAYSKNQRHNFKLIIVSNICNCVQLLVMYGYCSFKAIIGSITVGSFSVYLGAITSFMNNAFSVIYQLSNIRFLSHCADDYKAFVEAATPTHKVKGVNSIDTENGKHEFEFVNVSFKYPNTENYVLKNVSLKIATGERLSIVGYNGAGKSTFIKLLCRLYEPTEGVILYNGVDISTINYDQYRELLAVVFQDYQLFAFSVGDNIVLNREKNEKNIWTAIDKSGLSDKMLNLKNGLDTQLSKNFSADGIEFSGGEGQKLACARAYYRDSPVVILDEPTASLDPIAEAQLYGRFNEIIGTKTAIYISHRLASVKFCDKVAVFAAGELIEYGTHKELIERDGVYTEMFNKQAQYYREDVTV